MGGCGTAVDATDAGDAGAPDGAQLFDAGHDAGPRDSGVDAGSPGCEDLPVTPWDLTTGTWSADYGPRGLSYLGPRGPLVQDMAYRAGALYVAGRFTHAGPLEARNVARWTPSEGWSPLAEGLEDTGLRVAVASDATVYVAVRAEGAAFAREVHRFAGGAWSVIGRSTGSIDALAVDVDDTLLVGGASGSMDGIPTWGLARWDGSTWRDEPTSTGGWITAIGVDALGTCIAAQVGGWSATAVACRGPDETRFTPYSASGQRAPVDAIVHDPLDRAVIGGALYTGSTTQTQFPGILRWEGSDWAVVAQGLSDVNAGMRVRGLATTSGGAIYAVGNFQLIGPHDAPTDHAGYVARWTADRWTSVGGTDSRLGPVGLFAVASDGTNAYVGGALTVAYSPTGVLQAASAVARYDGGAWSALAHPGAAGHGPQNVSVVAARGSCSPVVAGQFDVVEDRVASHVAAVGGDGSLGPVSTTTGFSFTAPGALAVGRDGTIYAGSSTLLSRRGEVTVSMARNTAGEWESFGAFPAGAQVVALVVAPDGALYAGGTFVNPTSPQLSHLIRYDGGRWSAVGTRAAPAPVVALTYADDALYAAETAGAGGVQIMRFADGTWAPIGPTLAGAVWAVAVHRGAVIVGGNGLLDGTGQLARLDGDAWTALATSTRPYATVFALAGLGDELVIGGGDAIDHDAPGVLARLGPGGVEELAGGVDGVVRALAFSHEGLWVGGAFDVVGGTTPAWGLALLRAP